MYNAGTKLIEVSSIPRGFQQDNMAMLRDEVPAWNAAAAAYVTNANFYCAEDGVLFSIESQVNDGITNGKCRSILPWERSGFASVLFADDAQMRMEVSWSPGEPLAVANMVGGGTPARPSAQQAHKAVGQL